MIFKENELYQEIELFCGETKIGEAEIDIKNHMLARLCIFEPYQNQGLGTEIVKELVEKYDLKNLWVNADNSRAIHVYEKCGFRIGKSTMFEMVRDSQTIPEDLKESIRSNIKKWDDAAQKWYEELLTKKQEEVEKLKVEYDYEKIREVPKPECTQPIFYPCTEENL